MEDIENIEHIDQRIDAYRQSFQDAAKASVGVKEKGQAAYHIAKELTAREVTSEYLQNALELSGTDLMLVAAIVSHYEVIAPPELLD